MTYLALQIAAASWLVLLGAMIEPAPNFRSKLMFRAAPIVLGAGMAFFLVARFMGWPV